MANWNLTIDLSKVFHDHELPFTAKRDAIASAIGNSTWPEFTDSPVTLDSLVGHLRESVDVVHFNQIWIHVTDLALADRVRIETADDVVSGK